MTSSWGPSLCLFASSFSLPSPLLSQPFLGWEMMQRWDLPGLGVVVEGGVS